MKKSGKHQAKTKRAPMALRIGLLLLVVVAVFNGYTLAKYFMEKDQKVPVIAKNFYFESDLLAVSSGAVPQYTLQAGVDTISFSLMNYPDKLRESEVKISYTAVLTKDGEQVKLESSGSIDVGRKTVTVSFEGLDAGTYIVTATATSPYTQTLQGRFTIVDTSYDLSYSVLDGAGSPNLKVAVTTTDYSGDIVISWPDGVLPDNTDPLLENVSGNSCTIGVNAQSEYTFQFFKTNPNVDYSKSINVSSKS